MGDSGSALSSSPRGTAEGGSRVGPAGDPGSGVPPALGAPARALGKAGIGKQDEGVSWEAGRLARPPPPTAPLCPGRCCCGPHLHAQGEQRRLGASVSLFHQISRAELSLRESSRGELLASSRLVLGLGWHNSDLSLSAC